MNRSLYYTTPYKTLNSPLNVPWHEIHFMSKNEFEEWWAKTSRMLLRNYRLHNMPPKPGMTQDKLYSQIQELCGLDIATQIGTDLNDGSTCYLNTKKLSVADQFFPNIFEAKDKIGDRWISVLDQIKSAKIDTLIRVLKNDSGYKYAKTIQEQGNIEDYILSNKKRYGFIFYQPDKITKPLFKKYRCKVSKLKTLNSKGVIPKKAIRDVVGLPDSAIVYMKQYSLDQKVFPTAFSILQTTEIVAPTNFPAAVAKAVYSRYAKPPKKEEEVIIWDPSMGFGGRLMGALSCLDIPIHYIGTDPNSDNYFTEFKTSRYKNLERVFLNLARERKKTFKGTYINCGSEIVQNKAQFKKHKGKISLVFTSPPYFNAELYTNEKTQSALKYDNYHDWRESYYAETLKTAAIWLRKGGYLILNISNSGRYPIEEDTRIICRQLGLKQLDTEKMILANSPGAGRKRQGVPTTWNFASINGKDRKYEPILVFSKIGSIKKTSNFYFSKLHDRSSGGNKKKTNETKETHDAQYSYSCLKEIFKSYKVSMRNPYALFSTTLKNAIKNNQVKLVSHQKEIVAGFIINKRKTSGNVYSYKGTRPSVLSCYKNKADYEISAISIKQNNKNNIDALSRKLRSIKTPVWAECNASNQFINRALRSASYKKVSFYVNSHSDVMSVYFRGTKQQLRGRLVCVDKSELINITKLPIKKLSDKLINSTKEKLTSFPEFTTHNSFYNKNNNSWSALSLRGYLPDPCYIHDPLEATRKNINQKESKEHARWEKEYGKSNKWELQDTKLMDSFPEVQEILDMIVPGSSKNGNNSFKRIRFMKLTPNKGELERHTDLTDPETGLEDGKVARLHVPIKTNTNVIFTSWNKDDKPDNIHMRTGETWYLNTRMPHSAINGGKQERIHLVIDVISDQRIRRLIAGIDNAKSNKSNLLRDWEDPHPKPVIKTHGGFRVVRDDLLEYGSKCRFIDYMVKNTPENELVFGSSNKVGWGAISLAFVARKYGKRAVLFLAKRNEPTWHQQLAIDLGAKVYWISQGRLNVTMSHARKYVEKNPRERKLIPIGLEDESVLQSIEKVARDLNIRPKEVWVVASSGTLCRGLQRAFPKAKFFAVQIGHKLTKKEVNGATIYKSSYKYDQPVIEEEMPPYPSEPYYDAKLWKFIKKKGARGALIWNVAGVPNNI